MAKKILALVSAVMLLVCAVSVFTVVSVSAAIDSPYAGDAEKYPVKAEDLTTSHGGERLKDPDADDAATTQGFWAKTNADGSLRLHIGSCGSAVFGYYTTAGVKIDGAHLVVRNVKILSGSAPSIALYFRDGAKGQDGTFAKYIQFLATGAVSGQPLADGKGGNYDILGTDHAGVDVIKAIFDEGESTLFTTNVVDGGIEVVVKNSKGQFAVPTMTGFYHEVDLNNVSFGVSDSYGDNIMELDLLAIHGGDKECGIVEKLDFSADIETYGPKAEDFVNRYGEYGETADARGSKVSAGDRGVIVDVKSSQSAPIGAGLNKEYKLDGAHIIVGAYTSYVGEAVPMIALGSKLNAHFPEANMVKFDINAGRVYTYPGGGGDTLIKEGNEVIKAMGKYDSCVSFSVDADGNVWVTVTNDAGVATADYSIVTYGSEWTDHTKAYFYFGEHGGGQGKMIQHEVLAVHGGDEPCMYNANAAEKVIAQIDAIGTVTSASKAAVEAAEKAYALLSSTDKATVTNYEVLTAARAALDVCLAADADALIAAIGTVENTEECGAKITAAEEAYAALTAAQKELVTKKADLDAARAEYDEISGKNAADQAEADKVDALIEAIGEVAFNDECNAKITAAEEAYAALTDAQKARVAKYDVLVAARKAYNAANDAAFRFTYGIEIPVKAADVQSHHTPPVWIEDTDLGCLVEAMDKSDVHWAGRNSYNYAVGLHGLQIRLKGLDKMNDTISLALHDEPGSWTDSAGALITFLIYRDGGDGYGYVRAHNDYNGEYENKTPNPVWMVSFEENVWADNEMFIEFAIVDDTYGTVFFDGQRMGDFLLSDLGLEDVNECYVNFHHWSADKGKSSYCVYSITCKAQADAVAEVEAAIAAIGTVDANNEECVARIEAADDMRKALAKNLRKLVSNLDVLNDALAILGGETPTEDPTEDPTEPSNPKTGEAVAVLPIALLIAAAGAVVISRKRK